MAFFFFFFFSPQIVSIPAVKLFHIPSATGQLGAGGGGWEGGGGGAGVDRE